MPFLTPKTVVSIQIFLLVIVTVFSSTINIPIQTSPNSATISTNNQNCFSTIEGVCTQCMFGYYLVNGACVLGRQSCKTYDPIKGTCTSCYIGYNLENDSSCIVSQGAYLQQGCFYLSNGSCLSCSQGYYFNYQGNCQIIDTLCKIFNYQTKTCTSCYAGYSYKPNYNKCVYSDIVTDPNCIKWQNKECLACNNGFYIENGKCIQSNPNCRTFNELNSSVCLSCYRGYLLVENICLLDPLTSNNYLCSKYNSDNECIACSYRSFLNSLHHCTPINPLCLSFQENGVCLSCYNGFKLVNTTCLTDQQIIQDSNCALWSANNCVRCIPWTYLDSHNSCQQVNNLCRTYDSSNGDCTSCYTGYLLKEGLCVNNTDPYCKQYANNTCLSCYGGYSLNYTTLLCETVVTICQEIDPNQQGKCSSCYTGYYLQHGLCIQVDPLCQSFNYTIGECVACYGGYSLVNSTCMISN